MINLYNQDCLSAMKKMENDSFDLAIVDPPYFKEYGRKNYTGYDVSKANVKRQTKKIKNWSVPNQEYFDQLFRVSKNQIIWGANYYAHLIPHTGRIIWFKKNMSSTFSKCEIASHSFGVRVDYFAFKWNGMIQENMKNKEQRIHPTQKPLALYTWLLSNYAKQGDKILDTHLGSGSIAIACDNLGFDLDGYEIDEEYYKKASKRLELHQKQLKLFPQGG
jgi:site-specific DNA-methyltransferase (adenine-specific)|tara:strand:+ start:3659 stop:4315 length:657 start_codon:yes stop_codon:yes gene_type:complete